MRLKKVLLILLLVLGNFFAFGQIATLDDTALQIRERTFDRVWNIVNERHFDPTFGGVDWKKVGENYRPEAMASASETDFHNVLNQMIAELNQSHFSIYTKDSETEMTRCNVGVVGIDLRLLDNKAVINKIEPNSPAERAGVKPGFEIVKIDGRTVPELLLPLETNLSTRKISSSIKQAYRERLLTRALCGKPLSSVKIEMLNQKNITRIYDLKRVEYDGEIAKVAEGLPAFKLLFESKRLPNNIGYISFNVWLPKQTERVREAIRSMSNEKGIIIDLRNNAGGQGNLVNNVGGTLFSERISFGKTKTRLGSGDFWVVPQNKIFRGKIVILTNCGTGSTSEIFSAGMKESGRARIVGERTAGAVLPATLERLPTGAIFMYAVADYRSPNGILIEGRGVEPDVEVRLTRRSLLEGRDLQLEEAVREISR